MVFKIHNGHLYFQNKFNGSGMCDVFKDEYLILAYYSCYKYAECGCTKNYRRVILHPAQVLMTINQADKAKIIFNDSCYNSGVLDNANGRSIPYIFS